MKSFDKLPRKYEVSFKDVKYPYGAMNLIYSVEPKKLLAKVLKNQSDLDFSTSLNFHERDIIKKLKQKGYPVPEVKGVYKIFQKTLEKSVPGLIIEDKHDFVMLRSVPNLFHNYFKDFYEDLLINAEKDGFDVGDRNWGNCLCDLRDRKICLIDFQDWEYVGKGKKILSPVRTSFAIGA